MSDLPRYWSQEFVDRLVEALNLDPGFQRAARKFEGTIVLRCLDTPWGTDMSTAYRIDRGSVRADARIEPSPSRALRDEPFDPSLIFARTTAPFSLWTKLDRGEMNVLQAITSPDYRLEGSKLKVVANIGVFNAMSAVASGLPKRYA